MSRIRSGLKIYSGGMVVLALCRPSEQKKVWNLTFERTDKNAEFVIQDFNKS